jgi:chemotaxis protein histidine kinase CheA
MELDQELLDIFFEEVDQLKSELTIIAESLKQNNQQEELYLNFSQIVDRIYGTAVTMGLDEIGQYLGVIKVTSRKCGLAKIPRAFHPVSNLVSNCIFLMSKFQETLTDPQKASILYRQLDLEIKKADVLEKQIFAFVKGLSTTLEE